jgi:hypothetical protein
MKTETIEIDGITFIIQQFDAWRGGRMFLRTLKLLGPTLSGFVGLNPEMDIREAIPEIAESLQSLDPDEGMKFVGEMLECVIASIVDPQLGQRQIGLIGQQKITQVFNGKLVTMFKVAAASIRVNFADFIPGNGSSTAPLPAAVPTS